MSRKSSFLKKIGRVRRLNSPGPRKMVGKVYVMVHHGSSHKQGSVSLL
jgi:hypothetical protein